MVCTGAGCAAIPQPLKTYAGPELPPHAVARISGERSQRSAQPFAHVAGETVVACIDGVSLERYWGGYENGGRWPHRLVVAPGRHHLAVVYSLMAGQKAWWANVVVHAEAGLDYVIKGDGPEMWVVDSANGGVVAKATTRTAQSGAAPCP